PCVDVRRGDPANPDARTTSGFVTAQPPRRRLTMNAVKHAPAAPMILRAHTAAELMTPNPLSLREDVTLKEAIAFLVDRDLSGAPVIDEAGRPVGVLTQSDVLVHDREEVEHVVPPEAEYCAPLPPSSRDPFPIH